MSAENWRERLQEAIENRLSRVVESIELPQGDCRIVEMGIGVGQLLRLLVRKYPSADIVGIDRDISRAKKELEGKDQVCLLEEDAACTSLEDDSVDYIVYHNFLHHLPRNKVRDVLTEACRLVRRDGWVVIIENDPKPRNRQQKVLRDIYDLEAEIDMKLGRPGEVMFQPSELIGLLHETGSFTAHMKSHDEPSVVLPREAWTSMKANLLDSCRKLRDGGTGSYEVSIAGLDRAVAEHGIQLLPQYIVITRRM